MCLSGGFLFRRHEQTGAARQAGQHHGRLGQDFLDAAAGGGDARLDGGAFARAKFADFEQPVHE